MKKLDCNGFKLNKICITQIYWWSFLAD